MHRPSLCNRKSRLSVGKKALFLLEERLLQLICLFIGSTVTGRSCLLMIFIDSQLGCFSMPREVFRQALPQNNLADLHAGCWSAALIGNGLEEFTVEAGRPDSIDIDKLKILRKHGIDRISINPQTMNQKTLDLIGRRHTVDQVVDAFNMARECGFGNINMDLIVGLPGENKEDVRYTLNRVGILKPDSLTVHSLAIKRAAALNIFKDKYKGLCSENTDELMDMTYDFAESMGMKPYYLYRQKNMSGNFENVGFAREGAEGLYNILIMEEKQTILAAGANAQTKIVYNSPPRVDRIENVKSVDDYIRRTDEMIERKRCYFNGKSKQQAD